MKRMIPAVLVATLALAPSGGAQTSTRTPHQADKRAAAATIESQRDSLIELSDRIWRYAETALKETRSSEALADRAEAEGFRVTRGVAGMPTAFVAEYGSGSPVIGIMGEYDALPGISQKAQPEREALEAGAGGHGCGHNLFGVGSLGAAIAVKELMAAGRFRGTLRFFGTPAEEAVGGKIYMVRDGVMDGVDVMLAWHPSDEIASDTKSSQALVDLTIEFRGRSAHAAFDPWNGRSAADGLEIFTFATNMMREHVRPTSRMHYVVLSAGDVPNVVPEYAKAWMWLRDVRREVVDEMLQRVRSMAEGAALAAGVESSVSVNGGDWEMLVNMEGQRIAHRNLEWLGPLRFTPDEQEFARAIQRETGVEPKGLLTAVKPFDENPGLPEGGSTDVADVSWNVPTIHVSVTTAPTGAPWHAWPVVACGGMSIGHKGMIHAAKALAATMIDLYRDPGNVAAIRAEFAQKTSGITYEPYIPDGPPIPPPTR
ncbi:MAG TPA: amidohydrolase [Thermoanaerobaculia bacterium]|nr:amidohydrolase [Thermoanaerobaculia bacterium]